jgi:Undecaprenyl-phosphate glucose phosphotransferase
VSGLERIAFRRIVERSQWELSSTALVAVLVASEALLICGLAFASGLVWHVLAYGDAGPLSTYAAVGLLTAMLAILPFATQGDFRMQSIQAGYRTTQRMQVRWHAGLLLLGVVGFLTKTTAVFSRGWMILFWIAGTVCLAAFNTAVVHLVRNGVRRGHIAPPRLMIVGSSDEIAGFWARRGNVDRDDRVISVVRLPDLANLEGRARERLLADALKEAVEHGRVFGIDHVLLLPGDEPDAVLAQCIAAMSLLPVSIHLDAGPALDGVSNTRVEHVGRISALTLSDRPVQGLAAVAKRVFDVTASVAGFILLAPVLAVVAIAIKLDSNGPVLFFQRRRGYNHYEFRIVKFRTMTTLEDGDIVRQACRDDPRITRLGAFLRRYNLDELPQLWNVLKGEMSIVGPRPHAVAHDRDFERRIMRYPRRLNVKPGITGWAQVNGYRGETDTDDKMQRRIEYDLHYIDHWSLWLDLYIVVLTLSRRAFTNAR